MASAVKIKLPSLVSAMKEKHILYNLETMFPM